MTEPWERQPSDSKKAYAAFCDYRDMGAGRALDKLLARYQALPVTIIPPTRYRWTIHGWSHRNGWQARVAVWDAELDRQARLVQIEAVKAMNESHINLARAMLGILARRLQTLDPESLSPSDAARWAESLTKIERLARGEASERVDVMERVRRLARDLGLPDSETQAALTEAERIIRSGGS